MKQFTMTRIIRRARMSAASLALTVAIWALVTTAATAVPILLDSPLATQFDAHNASYYSAFTASYTAPAGTNRLLVVDVSLARTDSPTANGSPYPDSESYGGTWQASGGPVSMTYGARKSMNSGGGNFSIGVNQLWVPIGDSATAQSGTITVYVGDSSSATGNAEYAVVTARTYANVDQTNPRPVAYQNIFSGTGVSLSSQTLANSPVPVDYLVVDSAVDRTNGTNANFTAGSGQGDVYKSTVVNARIQSVMGDLGLTAAASPNMQYTSSVNADWAMCAVAYKSKYRIAATTSSGGTVSPWGTNGNIDYDYNASQTYTFTPNSGGYYVATVTVDGAPQARANSWPFGGIKASHTLDVTFRQDTIPPTVSFITPGPVYDTAQFTVTYADTGGSNLIASPTLTTSQVSLTFTGGVTGNVTSVTGSNPFYVTVSNLTGNGTVAITVAAGAAVDVAGNTSAASTSGPCSVDKTSPTLTLWTSAGAYVTTPTGAITVSVTLSEAVSDLVAGSISTVNAVVSNLTSSDSTHYSFTLTPSVEAPFSCLIASGAIHDLAGNGNLASNTISCTWDKTPPVATAIAPSTLYTNNTSVSFSVAFSEPVFNFASASNLVVTATGAASYTGAIISGSDANYTVTLTGLSGNGTLTMAVNLLSGVVDVAGNALASSVTSPVVTLEFTPPHATSITSSPNPTNGSTVTFAVTFDNPVLNFNDASDVVVTATGIVYGGVTFAGGPQNYTLTLTSVTGDGTVQVAVSTSSDVTDYAGNPLASSVTSAPVTVDHTDPNCIGSVPVTASPTDSNTVSFTVTFDEPVVNFNNASDVVVTQTGTVAHTGVVITGSGLSYTAQVTGVTGDGTMTLAANTSSDITDLATNPLTSSVWSQPVSIDHTPPRATTIVALNPNPTNSGTVIYNVTFSESVVNFNAASDLVITRTGSVMNTFAVVTGGPLIYTVDLTGVTGNGTIQLAVSTASDIVDVAGNPLASSVTSAVLTVDQSAPSLTSITVSGANPTNRTTVPFTVAFNKPVQYFGAASDLTVTLTGTAAYAGLTITGGPQNYTATLTGVAGTGTITVALSASANVEDLAGNPLQPSTATGAVTVDHTPPAVSVTPLTTNNARPTVSGTVSDDLGVSGVLVTVNGHTYSAIVSSDSWTAWLTNPLTQGTYDVVAKATDTAGNTTTDGTTNELVVDLTPPTITVKSQITSNTEPTLSGTVSDNVDVASVTVTVNGNAYPATISWGIWTTSVTDALPAGTYDVVAVATDTAGNTTTDSTTNELTIDFNVPAVTVNALTTSNPAPAVTGTATAQAGHNITLMSIVINGVTYPYEPSPAANSITWTVTPSPLPDGTYDVQATAQDELGRIGNDGTLNELTIDATPPTAALTLLAPAQTGRDVLPFHVVFSKPVIGFGTSVVTLAGSLTGTVAVTGLNPDYTVTVTLDSPDTDGTLGIVIGSGVTDIIGNAYAGGTSPVYSVFNWGGFTTEPQDARLYSGASQTFTAVADCGATSLAYQWKWDDGTKAVHNGPATSTWTITPVTMANAGSYWCEVSYDGSMYPTVTATLAVADHLAITAQPQGGQKVTGTPQTFTVGTSGGFTPLAYQWMKDGSIIPDATNASYAISLLQPGDSGSYTVEVSDADSDVRTSDPAQLTVSTITLPLVEAAGLAALLLVAAGIRALRRT